MIKMFILTYNENSFVDYCVYNTDTRMRSFITSDLTIVLNKIDYLSQPDFTEEYFTKHRYVIKDVKKFNTVAELIDNYTEWLI